MFCWFYWHFNYFSFPGEVSNVRGTILSTDEMKTRLFWVFPFLCCFETFAAQQPVLPASISDLWPAFHLPASPLFTFIPVYTLDHKSALISGALLRMRAPPLSQKAITLLTRPPPPPHAPCSLNFSLTQRLALTRTRPELSYLTVSEQIK